MKLKGFELARLTGRVGRGPFTHEVVTLWYRPPEILLGAVRYGPEIDIWSAGCVFAEMHSGRPLLHGDSEVDQLFRIFHLLGTPTSSTWPGVERYANYGARFPSWKGEGLAATQLGMPHEGIRLLEVGRGGGGRDWFRSLLTLTNHSQRLLTCSPAKRVTARAALADEYFAMDADKLKSLKQEQEEEEEAGGAAVEAPQPEAEAPAAAAAEADLQSAE